MKVGVTVMEYGENGKITCLTWLLFYFVYIVTYIHSTCTLEKEEPRTLNDWDCDLPKYPPTLPV